MTPLLLGLAILLPTFMLAQTSSEEDAIRQLRKNSNEAIARKDVKAIASIWCDDFIIVRGNGSYDVGKEMSIKSWEKLFATNPETTYERIPTEIKISEYNPELAWETGTWKGVNTYSHGGQYSAMWKKQKGEWKLQSELFVALLK